ncbi:MAG: type VI secretion system ATPase TssH [Gammaproteobacteria bacterium]|nr:type VI secretion system ATPase TssH [Gammaproteobacteria bacterium]
MLKVDVKSLVKKLNPFCTNALEGAIGLCIQSEHSEVVPAHWLDKLLQNSHSDFSLLLSGSNIDLSKFKHAVQKELTDLAKISGQRPFFSTHLLELIQDAWLIHSVHFGSDKLRSGAVLLALLQRSALQVTPSELSEISGNDLLKRFDILTESSLEKISQADVSLNTDSSLARFGEDLTMAARNGKLDPVLGRESEIRQMIDILSRRRKNNPILVGEAGVGKTALVEGLALKMIAGQVPDDIAKARLISLDLGLLEAGAGMKGEFEQRLKSILKEVEVSPEPIILFIDEAHLLIGSGGSQGHDAANLLKPALARGKIRLIAATTWSEYKKYIEKDAALTRRFQQVKVGEPSLSETITILRGLRTVFENNHQVMVRDDAIQACAQLSTKYLPDRQQPDKAIDLLDTACARVRVNLKAKPRDVVRLEEQIFALQTEESGLLKDLSQGVKIDRVQLAKVAIAVSSAADSLKKFNQQWQKELKLIQALILLRQAIDDAPTQSKMLVKLHRKRESLYKKLSELRGKNPLIFYEVDPDVIAQIVADWTQIPLGKLLRDEAEILLALEDQLHKKIKGQSEGVHWIAEQLKLAKAGLKDPYQPLGVFLLVGPSGVGKTETALTVADTLFGGESSLITVNMSEFQEKHTVSRLIGSPPGYVGYGEGGMLTEAVRKRPYSVVLLDEVEKAHPDVLNLFYQVFDKGVLTDSEGREVDFSNSVIFLTSNLASQEISALTSVNPDIAISEVLPCIRPILSGWFKPSLLVRMSIVPYFVLTEAILLEIITLKLASLQKRVLDQYQIELKFGEKLLKWLGAQCQETEMGARNLDLVIRSQVAPILSKYILEHMVDRDFAPLLKMDLNAKQTVILIGLY